MKWTLTELEPQTNGEQRWSVGENGPRAYLTTDAATAELISLTPELLGALIECIQVWEKTIPVPERMRYIIGRAQELLQSPV